jgi:hypothetical protein
MNGKRTIWTVGFDAVAVVNDYDIFTLEIPMTIRTPSTPKCMPLDCL